MKVFFLSLLLLISCSKQASEEDFLSNKETYINLYNIVKSLDFEAINPDFSSNKSLKIDSTNLKIIIKKMKSLNIKEIQRYDAGIFFMTGDCGWWGDGYLRAEIPSDEIVNLSIIYPITGNWYRWCQD